MLKYKDYKKHFIEEDDYDFSDMQGGLMLMCFLVSPFFIVMTFNKEINTIVALLLGIIGAIICTYIVYKLCNIVIVFSYLFYKIKKNKFDTKEMVKLNVAMKEINRYYSISTDKVFQNKIINRIDYSIKIPYSKVHQLFLNIHTNKKINMLMLEYKNIKNNKGTYSEEDYIKLILLCSDKIDDVLDEIIEEYLVNKEVKIMSKYNQRISYDNLLKTIDEVGIRKAIPQLSRIKEKDVVNKFKNKLDNI